MKKEKKSNLSNFVDPWGGIFFSLALIGAVCFTLVHKGQSAPYKRKKPKNTRTTTVYHSVTTPKAILIHLNYLANRYASSKCKHEEWGKVWLSRALTLNAKALAVKKIRAFIKKAGILCYGKRYYGNKLRQSIHAELVWLLLPENAEQDRMTNQAREKEFICQWRHRFKRLPKVVKTLLMKNRCLRDRGKAKMSPREKKVFTAWQAAFDCAFGNAKKKQCQARKFPHFPKGKILQWMRHAISGTKVRGLTMVLSVQKPQHVLTIYNKREIEVWRSMAGLWPQWDDRTCANTPNMKLLKGRACTELVQRNHPTRYHVKTITSCWTFKHCHYREGTYTKKTATSKPSSRPTK